MAEYNKRMHELDPLRRHLTKDELDQLESRPKTRLEKFLDVVICLLPIAAGCVALWEYNCVANLPGNETGTYYNYFLLFLMALAGLGFLAAMCGRKAFRWMRYKAPFYAFVFLVLAAYDWLTLKSGSLPLPYFPWLDQVITAAVEDHAYLLDCTKNSLILLFTGYFSGVGAGLVTGIACGCNKKINYWIEPFTRLLGAIPSTTWLPVVMVLASSLFKGSVFIIAMGVWYGVTISTVTGIVNIDRSYFEAARTLGVKGFGLVTRVAVPSALPSILGGMTHSMSTACTALIVAEMIGVESGLGWYIAWQKNWARYGNMYAALVVICVMFVLVNVVLSAARRWLLRWQEGGPR